MTNSWYVLVEAYSQCNPLVSIGPNWDSVRFYFNHLSQILAQNKDIELSQADCDCGSTV